ncbi:MAG: tRNA (adenosine(37)-N6)-threonylcarbamoyltransferase complex ATPase subunit type 1 TsaE [Anaerovoracaceae bacterium]|jgi:tRNA threonylcarbamoyladenosine biosynthesis protein TsaE
MMEQMRWRTEEDTKAFAQQLAQDARPGQVIALRGDLGTGKTALTRFLAQALGVREHITSPTFTIVREYRSGRLPLYHFDVYRIEDPEEMFELGYEEYFYGDGLCVIEWADRIAELLPEDTLDIRLEYGSTPQERLVTVRRPAERS